MFLCSLLQELLETKFFYLSQPKPNIYNFNVQKSERRKNINNIFFLSMKRVQNAESFFLLLTKNKININSDWL